MDIRNFAGAVIHTVPDDTLVGANLRGADLRDANLRGADLSRADLTGRLELPPARSQTLFPVRRFGIPTPVSPGNSLKVRVQA